MNFIQKIRASHLNRHGYLDILVGVILFQIFYVFLDDALGNFKDNVVVDSGVVKRFIFAALFLSPYFENLLLIGLAALHEKLFQRKGLFIVAPLILTATHFIGPVLLPVQYVIRVITLFTFFYIFLKQYELHKLEIGKHKALLLTSTLHFAMNATVMVLMFLMEPEIDAETIFFQHP